MITPLVLSLPWTISIIDYHQCYDLSSDNWKHSMDSNSHAEVDLKSHFYDGILTTFSYTIGVWPTNFTMCNTFSSSSGNMQRMQTKCQHKDICESSHISKLKTADNEVWKELKKVGPFKKQNFNKVIPSSRSDSPLKKQKVKIWFVL